MREFQTELTSETAPNQLELAAELLEINTERELDRFLPFLIGPALAGLKALAPIALKAAAPLFKGLAAKAVPLIKSAATQGVKQIGSSLAQSAARKRRQPSGQQREDRFLGNILSGILGGGELESEQFLGNILSGIFGGGELETETGDAQLDLSLRFVQLAQRAARQSARETIQLIRGGRQPTENDFRRLTLRALLGAARQMAPQLLPEGFDGSSSSTIDALARSSTPLPAAALGAGQSKRSGTGASGPQAASQPLTSAPVARGSAGRARWNREGDKLILSF